MRIRTVPGLLIGLTLVLALAAPAAAQSALTTFGVKGGLTISTTSLDLPEVEQTFGITIDPDTRTGLVAGVFFGGPISGRLGWQSEFLVGQKGLKFDDLGVEEEIQLTYIEIPALVQWSAAGAGRTAFHASAGPSFGFRVSEVQKEAGEELDFEDQTKTFDFGIAFGGGVSFDKLVIDARFTLGLTNIINETGKADLGPNADAKNRSFALTVGWRFR